MKIKSLKVSVSFWGNFKFRGDSYSEMVAVCSEKDGWTLEEAKLAHLVLGRELARECALDALTRGQFSKENFIAVEKNIEKSFMQRKAHLLHEPTIDAEKLESINES